MMQTGWKRLSASVCAAIFAAQMAYALPVTVFAADEEGTTLDGFDYSISGDDVTVTGYSGADRDSVTALRVPDTISGRAVNRIENGAFSGMNTVASLTLPDTVTFIGVSAFSGLAISSLDLPEQIQEIRAGFLSGCENLTEITIPKGLPINGLEYSRYMGGGYGATFKDSAIEHFILADGIEYIPSYLTVGDTYFAAIDIPSSVTAIGSSAFVGASFASFRVPDGVTEIGSYAFADCKNLTELTLPDSLLAIRDCAFSGTAITDIALPEGLTEMNASVFAGCESLTELTVPSTLASAQAMLKDSSVAVLHAADGMETLPARIAEGDKALRTVDLPRSVTAFGGNCFRASGIEQFTVPSQLTAGESDFYDSALQSVSFEDGLTIIPNKLFDRAKSLKEINWNPDITEIGESSFSDCDALQTAEIPDTVRTIGTSAFESCDSLTSLRIPEGGAKIGNYAFSSCDTLESVYLPVTASPEDSFGGYYDGYDYGFFQYCKSLKKIEFAPEMTVIPAGVCYSCESLTDIVFPTAPTEIGRYAFTYCKSLQTLHLPDTVTHADEFAFEYCSGITELHLPAEIIHIGRETFAHLDSLKSLYLPHELTDYGGYWPFRDGGIETLEIAEGITKIEGTFCLMPKLRTVVFPESLVEIGENAFSDDPVLTDVTLPENLTTIGNSAFDNCYSLTEITIPKSLTITGWSSFFSGSGLREVTFEKGTELIPSGICSNAKLLEVAHIPASVKEIGDSAFRNCDSLRILDMPQDVIEFAETAFANCDSLFDERVDLYDADDTVAVRVVSQQGENDLINYTVYYSVNPRFADVYKESGLDIWTKGSNPIDNGSLPQGLMDGEGLTTHLWVALNEPAGAFRFSTRPQEDADTAIDLQYYLKKEGKYSGWYQKRIAIDGNAVPRLSLSAPAYARIEDGNAVFSVFGFGDLDKEISIIVNDEQVKTVTSSAYTGRFSAELTVPAEEGAMLQVHAESGDIKSADNAVFCRSGQNEVKKVMLTITGHKTITEDITACFTEGRVPCFAYNPRYPLHFEVTLADNDCATVGVASTVNGKTSTIPLEFNAASGTWIGEGEFSPIVPGKLSIIAIQEKLDPIYRSVRDDGNYTYTLHGKDISDDKPLSGDEGFDWVSEFLKVSNPTLIGMDNSGFMMGFDYTVDGEFGAVSYYTGKSNTVVLDGKQVTSKEVAADPEQYGFAKSGARVIDENGKVHVYYVRCVNDAETIAANEELMSLGGVPESEPTAYPIVPKSLRFLRLAWENKVHAGMSAQEIAKASSTMTLEKILGEDEEDMGISTTVVNEIGNAQIGYWIDKAEKAAGMEGAGISGKIGDGLTMLDIAKETHYGYTQLDRITKSSAPYVDKHLDEVYTMSVCLTMAKVANVGLTAVAVGAVTAAFTTVTAPVALTIGVIVGVGWLVGKGLGILNDRLERIIKGEAELNCVGEYKVLIDPSGIAYEWLPSNPVAGVTAQIYYQDSSGNAVLWNAEDYDQINPQTTDAEGWFAWDVPEGLWQVRLSADGYEDTASEWLPVLPVQTGVNLNMRSTLPSAMKSVFAEHGSVTVKFTKHMLDDSITADSLYLTDSAGARIPCSILPVKEADNDTAASIAFRLTPQGTALPENCTLNLTAGAKSYAGTACAPATMPVMQRALPGDLNFDGDRSLADAVILARFLAEDGNMSPSLASRISESGVADVDQDGDYTLLDLRKMMRYLAGTEKIG